MEVETLSKKVGVELAKKASIHYDAHIKKSQFIPMCKHLKKFECHTKLYDPNRKMYNTLVGKAIMIGNPITVFFSCRRKSSTCDHTRESEGPNYFQVSDGVLHNKI